MNQLVYNYVFHNVMLFTVKSSYVEKYVAKDTFVRFKCY